MKIKIITGYRKDQAYSIDTQEAHKAYYLFFHPDTRTVFSSGLAIKGEDIDHIEPDYQGTMGWNPNHTLDDDDMNEIRRAGVEKNLRGIMATASEVAKLASPQDLNLSLEEVLKKYPELNFAPEERGGGMKRIG